MKQGTVASRPTRSYPMEIGGSYGRLTQGRIHVQAASLPGVQVVAHRQKSLCPFLRMT